MPSTELIQEVDSFLVQLLAFTGIPAALHAHDLFDIAPLGEAETKVKAQGRVLVDRETFMETLRVPGDDKSLAVERLTDLYIDALSLKGAAATKTRTFPDLGPKGAVRSVHYLISRAAAGDVFITTDCSPEKQR